MPVTQATFEPDNFNTDACNVGGRAGWVTGRHWGWLTVGALRTAVYNVDLTRLLRANTEDGIRDHYRQLRLAREQAASALKRNVHDNYTEFIKTSREIHSTVSSPRPPRSATSTDPFPALLSISPPLHPL